MEIIELDENGLAYVLISIKPRERHIHRQIPFKLDTAAGITTISKKSLKQLSYDDAWVKNNTIIGPIKEVSSAGRGYEPAYCVVLPISTIQGKSLKNWPFYIRPEDDRDYRNLLGIDILSHFDFSFNYRKGYVKMNPIHDSYIDFPMLPNQSIDELEVD
ncbi:MAG: hypothetical protein FWE83_04400 [Oscillospiraceae bacterium]|nr:hypothetical protein [Oscillospiraceae bacterium]